MLNSLRAIMSISKEDLTTDIENENLEGSDTNINDVQDDQVVVSEANIVDPDTNVDAVLQTNNEEVQELVDLETGIEVAEQTRDSIVNIAEAVENTLAEDGAGLKPAEAEVINIAVECLKKRIGYKGNRKLPAMESFGGTMPKRKATQLAVEDLNSLTVEINTQLDKTYILRYSDNIRLINKDIETKGVLLGYVNGTISKSSEFFNSGRYNPAVNGRDLPGGNVYIGKLFNLSESSEGKMPTAAIVSGFDAFKTSFGSLAYLELIKELRVAVQSLNNDVNLTQDVVSTKVRELVAKYNNLFGSDKKYTNEYCLNYSTTIPLGGSKIEISSRLLSDTNNYWYGSCVIEKQLVPDDVEPKLGALSNVEMDQILNGILNQIQGTEFSTELVGLIEDMIVFAKVSQKVNNKDTDSLGTLDTCGEGESISSFKSVIETFIYYFGLISKYELKVYNALVNYCNDSLLTHSSNTVELVNPPEGSTSDENGSTDTNTPPSDNNGSEAPTDNSEGTPEGQSDNNTDNTDTASE